MGKFDKDYYRDYTYSKAYPKFENWVKIWRKLFRPNTVLDIGCAKGFSVLAFVKQGVDAYGVDNSTYAISCVPKTVRDRCFHLNVEKDRLPFSEGFFDLITIFDVLGYLHDFDHTLKEITRVLKPGGHVVALNPFKYIRPDPYYFVRSRLFWIELFQKYGLRYQPPMSYKEIYRMYLKSIPSTSKIGRFLMSFGKLGKSIRVYLGAYLWTKSDNLIIFIK